MAVHGGKVYALGGFDGVQRLTSVEAYDPFHNRWTQVNIQEFDITAILLYKVMLNVPNSVNISACNLFVH